MACEPLPCLIAAVSAGISLAAIDAIVPSAVLGLATLAALYALHHLRTQPERRRVATLQFWRNAARAMQRSRTLWSRRFTNRGVFALLAAVALLLTAALAADRSRATIAAQDVIVIDAGDAMARRGADGRTAFATGIDEARRDLAIATSGAAVILAGDRPTLLATPGEPAAVALRRLATATPGASRASDAASALTLARALQRDGRGAIDWFTTRDALPPGVPPDVASRVRLRRIAVRDGVAIVGVTWESSEDRGDRGRLRVHVAGDDAGVVVPILVCRSTDGSSREAAMTFRGSDGEAILDGVAGDGSTLQLSLASTSRAAGEQRVEYRLPRRTPLTFRFVGDIPVPLRAALLAIGSEDAAGAIAVVGLGDDVPNDAVWAVQVTASIPAPGGTDGQWGEGADGDPPAARLAADVARVATSSTALPIGPGRVLLRSRGGALVRLQEAGPTRRLQISAGLVGMDAELPRRSTFPLLLRYWCDELAGESPSSSVLDRERIAADPLWPPLAGSARPRTVVAERPEVPQDAARPRAIDLPVPSAPWRPAFSWTESLLGVALAALCLDAGLHLTKRIV